MSLLGLKKYRKFVKNIKDNCIWQLTFNATWQPCTFYKLFREVGIDQGGPSIKCNTFRLGLPDKGLAIKLCCSSNIK